ncbi:MAG: hypothetical protein P1V35_17120 [Planctomycetota bacterium]|nr:hypothetical protein [Planctomycetota bacterium]
MITALRSPWTPLIVCVVLAVTYTLTQERIGYEQGRPYDSAVYYQMAGQVAEGTPIATFKPFVYRLGVPFLVGKLFPDDPMHGYEVVGIVFGVLLVLFLYLLLRAYGLSRAMAGWLVALYIANPYSPFRYVPFLPVNVEPAAFAFVLASFWMFKVNPVLNFRSTAGLVVLGCLGALVREVVLVVPLTFLGAHLLRCVGNGDARLASRQTAYRMLILLCTIGSLVATRYMVHDAMGAYETLSHMEASFQRNRQFPEILLLCLMTAIGPLLFIVAIALGKGSMRKDLGEHVELPIFLAGMAVLSAIAGNHTDRFVFWLLPGFLPILGWALRDGWLGWKSPTGQALFYGPVLAAQLLVYRAFVSFPATEHETLSQPGQATLPLFMNYGEGVNLGQVTVAFMTRANRIPLLIEFGVLAVYLTAVWLCFRKPSTSSAQG